MFLENATIKNFRSIETVSLEHCRALNVLIGKNNAGKSNILGAIHGFFTCIQGGRIVAPHPPLGAEINFFNKQCGEPVEITLEFSLDASERRILLDEIALEAPQVKNALDGLDPDFGLAITLNVTRKPEHFAIVRHILLVSSADSSAKQHRTERVLLHVGPEAASELYSKAAKGQQLLKDAKALKDLPERASFRARGLESEQLLSYYLRQGGGEISPNVATQVEALIKASPESEDILPSIRKLISKIEAEASDLQREQLKNTIKTFSGEETAIPKYVVSLIDRIGGFGVLYLSERRKPIGKEEAQRLLELKMSRGGPQVLKRIQETVAALLGVQIDAFRGDSRSPRSEAEAELDVDNFLVQVNGSGIKEALRLILDNEFQRPSLLLIEEPEVHLHPALESSIMRYLQSISSSCQVFLTTHSTNFLDSAEFTNVYLVERSNSTVVQLLDMDSAEALLPRELGLRLSSLFMYDRLVFVEGRTDEGILRQWAALMNINLSQANVGFVKMGGVRNFTHYAAAATLGFLSKRQVRCWILLDRDEKDDQEIARLKNIAADHASVTVLEHREIENLLLQPRVIAELVKKKLRDLGRPTNVVTEEAIETKLKVALETLKPIAVHKRVAKAICGPIYPSAEVFELQDDQSSSDKVREALDKMITVLTTAKGKLEETCARMASLVEHDWHNKKVQIVPGDLALEVVLKEYGLRFNKDHDGAQLAGFMRADEIDPKMRSFLEELGAI